MEPENIKDLMETAGSLVFPLFRSYSMQTLVTHFFICAMADLNDQF